ncbi:hypothetical protein SAMN05443574_101497 [Haloarcula vallismortis]|uniref:DUF2975 domain-containing protein n=2 Tax=Haloarcula vallismortis TaxID=28442 RepID=M0IZ70_HALVA|nr:hypothetical protein [Haloarcula vallismortis]EMA01064.1 hypothetical protein C437_19757 [Haloarcula vallismortis ATCC 29715]SDW14281.1 hypothetical protein SAMN05443574_101497 [Haloarcula vallismortis]
MSSSIRSLTKDFAALFSSLVLLGPLTLGLLVLAGRIVADPIGIAIPDALGTIGFSVAALLALWLALEGAMVQRHGLEAMDRGGSFQRAARYLLVTVTTLAGVIVSVRFLALSLPWAFETQNTPAQILGVLLVAAVVAALYRTLTAARDGYNSEH